MNGIDHQDVPNRGDYTTKYKPLLLDPSNCQSGGSDVARITDIDIRSVDAHEKYGSKGLALKKSVRQLLMVGGCAQHQRRPPIQDGLSDSAANMKGIYRIADQRRAAVSIRPSMQAYLDGSKLNNFQHAQ